MQRECDGNSLFEIVGIAWDGIEQMDGLVGHLEYGQGPAALSGSTQFCEGPIQAGSVAYTWTVVP